MLLKLKAVIRNSVFHYDIFQNKTTVTFVDPDKSSGL